MSWFDWNFPGLILLLFHIPNGGHRHLLVAKKMKAEGVRRGVPDLMFAFPCGDYHGLFIEMKTLTGTTSKDQKNVIKALKGQNYCVEVCKGYEAAKETILNYMGGRGNPWKRTIG